jgi:hypothetical protein
MPTQQTVLLVGATGRTGGRVLEQLLGRGVGVREQCLGQSPSGSRHTPRRLREGVSRGPLQPGPSGQGQPASRGFSSREDRAKWRLRPVGGGSTGHAPQGRRLGVHVARGPRERSLRARQHEHGQRRALHVRARDEPYDLANVARQAASDHQCEAFGGNDAVKPFRVTIDEAWSSTVAPAVRSIG